MTAPPPATCPAVEDVTGQPCRRTCCDGAHSAQPGDPWAAVGERDEANTTTEEAS